jgi:hypothetical protein
MKQKLYFAKALLCGLLAMVLLTVGIAFDLFVRVFVI